MPKVGKKHYPYTKKGIQDAKVDASKSGESLVGYKHGGPVQPSGLPARVQKRVRGGGAATKGLGFWAPEDES